MSDSSSGLLTAPGSGPVPAPVVPPLRQAAGSVLLVGGGLLVAGVLLGAVWWLLAPTVTCTMGALGCSSTYESGRFFIAEGIFAGLLALCGLLAGVLTRRWIDRIGWPVVVALAVGGLLASLVAWRVGVWLGPDDAAVVGLAPGATAELPLRLRSTGLLLAAPIASLMVSVWVTVSSDGTEPPAGDRAAADEAPRPDQPAAVPH